MKKNLTICLGVLIATAGITAYGLENVKENRTLPQNEERQNPMLTLRKLGERLTPPLRVLTDAVYDLPFSIQPTAEQFDECEIIDVNADGKGWTYESSDGGSFKFSWHGTNTGDDWCILPTMNLPAGNFKLTYTCKTGNYVESFRISLGHNTDLDSYTQVLSEKVDYKNQEWVTNEVIFSVDEAGEYNLGLYAFSKPDQFYAYIRDISVVAMNDNMPAQPEIVSFTSEVTDATLTVLLPSQNYGGNPIEGNVDLAVYIKGSTDPIATCTGLPGEQKVLNFTVENTGEYDFQIIATVEIDGETLSCEPLSVTHKFTKSQPVPLPLGYVIEPDEDEFSWCEVINSNGDNNEWEYYSDSGLPSAGREYPGAFRYYYSYSYPADDWLILPAYDGAEGGAMQVAFLVATKYDMESLEVGVASTPDVAALSENIVWSNPTLKTSDEFVLEDATFTHTAGEDIYVGFHVTSPAYRNQVFIQGVTVKKMNGETPTQVTLSDAEFDGGNGTVKLTMPTHNLGGVEIEGTIYADVVIDEDIQYSEESVAGTAGEEILLTFSDLSLGDHTVTATPYVLAEDGTKLYGKSNSLTFRINPSSDFYYTLPMDLTFNETTSGMLEVIDANEDGKTWTYSGSSMVYSYNTANPGDDWFITCAIDIPDATKLYDLKVYGKVQSSSYPEAFEVKLGKERTVEGMTIDAIRKTVLTSVEVTEVNGMITVPEAGRYYMGVHCVSDANMYKLFIDRIELQESTMSPEVPGKVTDLTAAGNITGALNATVSFTFPFTNMLGEELPEGQALTATVTSGVESKEVTGTPGVPGSVEIECPEGITDISVKVANEAGEGMAAITQVNCGLDKPMAPVISGYEISEDNGSVTISWEAVTEGVHGGNVNPAGMDYYLWEWDEEDEDWYQVDVTDQLSVVYEYSTTEPQELIRLGIQCYNGLNSGSTISSISVVLGKPYELPMEEDFADGESHNSPITMSSSMSSYYMPTWEIANPSTVVEGLESPKGGYSLYGHTNYSSGDTYLGLPKFSTLNYVPTVKFTTYSAPTACTIQVIASTYGMEGYEEVGEVELPETNLGWVSHSFVLPEQFANKGWVDVKLVFNFVNGSSSIALLDSYEISGTPVVGVDKVSGKYQTVAGLKGGILVSGFAGENIVVVNAAGQVITSKKVAETENISVTPGIYMVNTADKTYKVVVK